MNEIIREQLDWFIPEQEERYKYIIDCIASRICPKCGKGFNRGYDTFDYEKIINTWPKKSTNHLCANCDVFSIQP